MNASYYVTKLLPNLIKDCRHLLSDHFIFQQDGAPAHTAALAQDWIKKKCPGFIGKRRMASGHRIRQISVHWIIMTADIHHWNVWTVDERVVQSLIRYFWIFRTRLHVHLKKWTLNFKLFSAGLTHKRTKRTLRAPSCKGAPSMAGLTSKHGTHMRRARG